MSDMTDCSYEKGGVSGNDVNNDYLNRITGFCGFDSSDDKHGLGATNARGVGREWRGNLRGGCMSKLCVE